MATININVDEHVKQEANELFKSLGLDMTTALNLFLRQAIHYGGIPFEIRKPHPCSVSSDEELLMKLQEAEEKIVKNGTISHDEFWNVMRGKYGNDV
ncbi:MAG: type II toxin-antitoxin system RelB/DinJ family antitoxin [Clostridia bacterium]|nr:type II toxin-antitoxin system RelB/DinJ family antitoxin [Clostridia bacterium]